jgi:flagellar protein FlbT
VPLKITLKPGERVLLGGVLLTNGPHASSFTVENEVPILRAKDLMSERAADTVCKKIYYSIQAMYFDRPNLAEHHKTYWHLVRRLSAAVPSALPLLDETSALILDERYYQALKAARKLIAYEAELTTASARPSSLPTSS